MSDDLEEHQNTINIGDHNIRNLCFANNIDGLVCNEEELVSLMKYPPDIAEINVKKTLQQ